MPSRLNNKRKKVREAGYCWYKDNGALWGFNVNWHWSAEHYKFSSERDLINKVYKHTFPTKKVELIVTFGDS